MGCLQLLNARKMKEEEEKLRVEKFKANILEKYALATRCDGLATTIKPRKFTRFSTPLLLRKEGMFNKEEANSQQKTLNYDLSLEVVNIELDRSFFQRRFSELSIPLIKMGLRDRSIKITDLAESNSKVNPSQTVNFIVMKLQLNKLIKVELPDNISVSANEKSEGTAVFNSGKDLDLNVLRYKNLIVRAMEDIDYISIELFNCKSNVLVGDLKKNASAIVECQVPLFLINKVSGVNFNDFIQVYLFDTSTDSIVGLINLNLNIEVSDREVVTNEKLKPKKINKRKKQNKIDMMKTGDLNPSLLNGFSKYMQDKLSKYKLVNALELIDFSETYMLRNFLNSEENIVNFRYFEIFEEIFSYVQKGQIRPIKNILLDSDPSSAFFSVGERKINYFSFYILFYILNFHFSLYEQELRKLKEEPKSNKGDNLEIFKKIVQSKFLFEISDLIEAFTIESANFNFPLINLILKFYYRIGNEELLELCLPKISTLSFIFTKFGVVLSSKNKFMIYNSSIFNSAEVFNLKRFGLLFMNSIIAILNYRVSSLKQLDRRSSKFELEAGNLLDLMKNDFSFFKEYLSSLISFQDYYFTGYTPFIECILIIVRLFQDYCLLFSIRFNIKQYKMINTIYKSNLIRNWMLTNYLNNSQNIDFLLLYYEMMTRILSTDFCQEIFFFFKLFNPVIFFLKPIFQDLSQPKIQKCLYFQIRILHKLSCLIKYEVCEYIDFIDLNSTLYSMLCSQVNNYLILISHSRQILRTQVLSQKCALLSSDKNYYALYKQCPNNDTIAESDLVNSLVLYSLKIFDNLLKKPVLLQKYFKLQDPKFRMMSIISFQVVAFALVSIDQSEVDQMNIELIDISSKNPELLYFIIIEILVLITNMSSANETIYQVFQNHVKLAFTDLLVSVNVGFHSSSIYRSLLNGIVGAITRLNSEEKRVIDSELKLKIEKFIRLLNEQEHLQSSSSLMV